MSEEIERLIAEKNLDKDKIFRLTEEKSKVTQEMGHKVILWLQFILGRAENCILKTNKVTPETEKVVNEIIDDIIEASNKFLPNE